MFPNELLMKIFAELNLNTRINLLYVSDRFKEITQNFEYNHQVKLIRYRDVKLKLTNVKIINVDDDDEFHYERDVTEKEWKCLSKSLHLKKLDLRQCSVTDCHLESLIELPHLNDLVLFKKNKDNELEVLRSLLNLKKLTIYCNDESDDEEPTYNLNELKTLINLTRFECHYGDIQDDHLEFLKELTRLKKLTLFYCNITDDGLNNIKELTSLTHLNIQGCCQSTDNNLDFLQKLTQIKRLNLNAISFGSKELIKLGNLTRLTHLSLIYCIKKDDSLEYISKLTSLKELNLSSSHKITLNGLKSLERLSNLQRLYIKYQTDKQKEYLKTILDPKIIIH